MRIRAVAFDLGNTLVEYYQRESFPSILVESICSAHAVLRNFAVVPLAEAQAVALTENVERPDGKVRPLRDRLATIFGLAEQTPEAVREQALHAFLQPIFRCARKYEDSAPTLRMLRQQGYRLAIVSNTPWGSPSNLWREEINRLNLADMVDVSIFCVDVGWRKSSPIIFECLLQALNVTAPECLFVGDEPVWDVEGASDAGMPAILIDRANRHTGYNGIRVQSLEEIAHHLGSTSKTVAGYFARPSGTKVQNDGGPLSRIGNRQLDSSANDAKNDFD